MRQKQWNDLSDTQKRGIVLLGALQLMLLAAALLDIRWRAPDMINGSKRLWRMVVFINCIGPIVYFLFGRSLSERSHIAIRGRVVRSAHPSYRAGLPGAMGTAA